MIVGAYGKDFQDSIYFECIQVHSYQIMPFYFLQILTKSFGFLGTTKVGFNTVQIVHFEAYIAMLLQYFCKCYILVRVCDN